MVASVSLGGVAAIVAAVFWAALVVYLILTLRPIRQILQTATTLVDGTGQRLQSLLEESTSTASSANKDLDTLGRVLDDVHDITQRAVRITSLLERVVTWPLEKLLAVTKAISGLFGRFRRAA